MQDYGWYLERPAPVNGKMRLLRGNFSSLKYIQTKIDYAERDGDGWSLNLLSIKDNVIDQLRAWLGEREHHALGIVPGSPPAVKPDSLELGLRAKCFAAHRPTRESCGQGEIRDLDNHCVAVFGVWRAVPGAILIRHCDSDVEAAAAHEAAVVMLAAQGGGGTVACISLPPIVDGVICVGDFPEFTHLGRGYDVVFMPEVKHRRAGLLRKDRDSLRAIVRAARAGDPDFNRDLVTVRSRGQRANLIAEKLHAHTSYKRREDLARALRNKPVLLDYLCVHTKK